MDDLHIKIGIEIHQQLDTGKLFCRCQSLLREDAPDIKITRKLRAAAGETGEIDVAASHEHARDLSFIYEAYSDTTCLVELDEEPPHEIDRNALNTVLQVSKMLGASIVDEIQVMRKTVVNGSNTSGFQRTALVARNGMMNTSLGKVRIPTIMIEEDAARETGRDASSVTYRLDRLGVPLIEIGTEPDIVSPEHAKEAAETLGMILRSTGCVKRGLGTIRQDVNVSIAGGSRVEIKGCQDLRMIPTIVELEGKRQKALLDIKAALSAGISKATVDVTEIFMHSESKVILGAIAHSGIVLGMKLPGFKGLIGREISPGKRLGTEFSAYAKVNAGVGGIFHSDEELYKYAITDSQVKQVAKKLGCAEKDAFVLVADDRAKCAKALDAVFLRAQMCFDGVPREVRRANPDGTTTFMRPMPGKARLYPETDIQPIKIGSAMLDRIKLPELLSEKKSRFIEEHELGKDLASLLTKLNKHELFEGLAAKYKNVKPAFIAETLTGKMLEIKRKYSVDLSKISDSDIDKVFSILDMGEIAAASVEIILAAIAKGVAVDYSKYKLFSDRELEGEIKKIIAANKGLPFNALIGKAMALKTRADPAKIAEILKKLT